MELSMSCTAGISQDRTVQMVVAPELVRNRCFNTWDTVLAARGTVPSTHGVPLGNGHFDFQVLEVLAADQL